MKIDEFDLDHLDFNPRHRKKVRLFGIFIFVLMVLFAIYTLFNFQGYSEQITKQTNTYGMLTLFVSIFLLEFIPNFLNPYLPLIVSFILGFNIFTTIIVASIASLFGAFLGYEVGRKYGLKLTSSLFHKEDFIKIVKSWNKYGKWFVFVSVFTPLPYFPIIFGSLGMSRKNIWVYGIIPRIILFSLIGLAFIYA